MQRGKTTVRIQIWDLEVLRQFPRFLSTTRDAAHRMETRLTWTTSRPQDESLLQDSAGEAATHYSRRNSWLLLAATLVHALFLRPLNSTDFPIVKPTHWLRYSAPLERFRLAIVLPVLRVHFHQSAVLSELPVVENLNGARAASSFHGS